MLVIIRMPESNGLRSCGPTWM